MISQRIKYHRLMQNITQRDLSASAGLASGVIANIEGRNDDIMLSTAIKIKNALGLKAVEDLMKPFTKHEISQRKQLIENLDAERKRRKLEQRKEYRARYRARIKEGNQVYSTTNNMA